MKSIFKLLLVLAIFGTTEFLAITPPNEIEKQPIEFSIADHGDVISLEINSVNLSMEKSNSFIEFKNGVKFEIPLICGANTGKGNISFVNHFDEVTKLETTVIDNLIFRQNTLDKIINQIPENIDLQNLEPPFEFILNKTEFKKIEHLLDKRQTYKNFKVTIFDKAPDDLIYLRQKKPSKYF